ncbi:MAG: alpha/beta hydrolase [Burkholderiaceae bacterium]
MSVDAFNTAQRRMLARHGVDAQARFVDVPSIAGRAQVLVVGDGSPVVMINGIGTPAAMWAPLMAQLGGFRLYAVDLPGFGLTDTVQDLTRHYRATAVQFLCETLDSLGLDQAAFVANSLGSRWAIWLALDLPERVSAMVHIGCPATVLGTSAPLPMRLMSVPSLARLLMKLQPPSHKQVEQLSKMVHQHPLEPELADLLVATERLPHFEHPFLATLNTLVRLRGARPEMALWGSELGRIRQPTQIVWGDDDPMGSTTVARRVADAIPRAELHIVEGGHAPWLTRAGQIGSLASAFLGRHTAAVASAATCS